MEDCNPVANTLDFSLSTLYPTLPGLAIGRLLLPLHHTLTSDTGDGFVTERGCEALAKA